MHSGFSRFPFFFRAFRLQSLVRGGLTRVSRHVLPAVVCSPRACRLDALAWECVSLAAGSPVRDGQAPQADMARGAVELAESESGRDVPEALISWLTDVPALGF